MGLLSKVFKKVVKPLIGGILGFAVGGPIGAIAGAGMGLQMQASQDAAKKAEAAAQEQERLANAAPTVIQAPSSVVTQADEASAESAAGEKRRRLSVDKTANSGSALRTMASSYGSNRRKTLA